MHRVAALFLVSTLLPIGYLPAQLRYGDLILADLNGQQQLWVLNRTTRIFTTLTPASVEYPTCVTMAKNNSDMVMTLASRWMQTTYLVLVSPMGGTTPLSLGGFWHNAGSVALHENGADYVVGMWWAKALWRVNMTNRNTLTSCVIQNIAHLETLTHDSDTGDWVVVGNGNPFRVSEVNCAQTTLSSVYYQLDSIDLKPRTGPLTG